MGGRAGLLAPLADATTGEAVEIRALSDYDAALGRVDEEAG